MYSNVQEDEKKDGMMNEQRNGNRVMVEKDWNIFVYGQEAIAFF